MRRREAGHDGDHVERPVSAPYRLIGSVSEHEEGCGDARGQRLLDGERDRALGDSRPEGNFLATRVRHYLTAGGAEVAHPTRRGATSVEALPVALLRYTPGDRALQLAALRRAVDLAVITRRAEVHDAAARIANTLNLSKIVHPRRERPPGIGPSRTSRATTASSYASTRGDRGLGVSAPGPFS
jgi:hypothetical protein